MEHEQIVALLQSLLAPQGAYQVRPPVNPQQIEREDKPIQTMPLTNNPLVLMAGGMEGMGWEELMANRETQGAGDLLRQAMARNIARNTGKPEPSMFLRMPPGEATLVDKLRALLARL